MAEPNKFEAAWIRWFEFVKQHVSKNSTFPPGEQWRVETIAAECASRLVSPGYTRANFPTTPKPDDEGKGK